MPTTVFNRRNRIITSTGDLVYRVKLSLGECVRQAGDSDWGNILLQEKIPWMFKPLIPKVLNNVFKVVQCLLPKSFGFF